MFRYRISFLWNKVGSHKVLHDVHFVILLKRFGLPRVVAFDTENGLLLSLDRCGGEEKCGYRSVVVNKVDR